MTLAASAVACGSDSSADDAGAQTDGSAAPETADLPTIVVTTNILGDIVSEAVGPHAEVEVIMSLGTDPHDFAPSARQAETMENADLLVVNGAGFEEGMLDIIANVQDSGTPVFTFADQVELLQFDGERSHEDEHSDEEEHADEEHSHDDDHSDDEGHADDEHSDEEEHSDDEEHADEEHSDGEEHSDDEHEHEEGSDDPHIWTDPTRIATAVAELEVAVAELDGVDDAALATSFDEYVASLDELDASMESTLDVVPDEGRILVTNHEVFGYFADRYDFEVLGAIIPSLTTNAEASASDIEELAALITAEGVPAIFGETTQSSQLADVLADEIGGDVEVVELYSESLGEEGSGAETYIAMMSTNANRIAEALAP
ncbi:metal ABC transporter substrate-binding protein [Ilumatobacter nonamiensis]|uniref:metal ABC transporter substrate-binding protein n=1 Tax=Ilumatobacter nonamiensis TaxID=467093 RepID=UPI00034D7F4C|nr:metal ABC transporter substrate-binding protein [Ilumatobacter nonamiensis]